MVEEAALFYTEQEGFQDSIYINKFYNSQDHNIFQRD